MAQRRRRRRAKYQKKEHKIRTNSNRFDDDIRTDSFYFDEWITEHRFTQIQHIFIKHGLNTKDTLNTASTEFVMFVSDPSLQSNPDLLSNVIAAIQKLSKSKHHKRKHASSEYTIMSKAEENIIHSLQSKLHKLKAKKLSLKALRKKYKKSMEERESMQTKDAKDQIHVFFNQLHDKLTTKEQELMDQVADEYVDQVLDDQIESQIISKSIVLIDYVQQKVSDALKTCKNIINSTSNQNQTERVQEIHNINDNVQKHYIATNQALTKNINFIESAITTNKQQIIKPYTFDTDKKQSKRIMDGIQSISLNGGKSDDEEHQNVNNEALQKCQEIINHQLQEIQKYKAQIMKMKEAVIDKEDHKEQEGTQETQSLDNMKSRNSLKGNQEEEGQRVNVEQYQSQIDEQYKQMEQYQDIIQILKLKDQANQKIMHESAVKYNQLEAMYNEIRSKYAQFMEQESVEKQMLRNQIESYKSKQLEYEQKLKYAQCYQVNLEEQIGANAMNIVNQQQQINALQGELTANQESLNNALWENQLLQQGQASNVAADFQSEQVFGHNQCQLWKVTMSFGGMKVTATDAIKREAKLKAAQNFVAFAKHYIQ